MSAVGDVLVASGLQPYFEQDGIQIFHADCREVLPHVGSFDLCLTDPPYGIASIWSGGSELHGWTKANSEAGLRNEWDAERPSADCFTYCQAVSEMQIIWGGNYFADLLPATRGWLVWNKPERGFSLAEAELAWTNRDAVVRVYDGPRSEPDRVHPTQKPLALMLWCISKAKNPQSVIDPFLGSGTTLVACKKLGIRGVGIEREEKYCEIAAKRLANTTPSLFTQAVTA